VQLAEAEIPQRPEPERQVLLAAIEFNEVKKEVDLDRPLVAGEVAESAGEGSGVEARRIESVHGVHLQCTALLACVSGRSGKAPGGPDHAR
jgi:hypothetical protein